MRIVVTSDTHEKHSQLHVPDGDVFIHCGDFTLIGEPEWADAFNVWLGMLPHKHKIVVAGNHDRSFDVGEGALAYGQSRLPNATYLLNSGVEIEGKRFWGSPYTPFFSSDFWKFHYDRAEGEEMWRAMPEGLDVLITHGPPMYEGDKTLEGDFPGCWDLNRAVKEKKPHHHFFGHIHEGYGETRDDATLYHNVSAVDRLYRMRPDPCVVVEI
jgi:Icc-related predicted phosphoesterase